jgi:hypothetical protein
MQLEDTSWSPERSELSCRLEIEIEAESKTCFLFFAVLKKALAGCYRIEGGVASIGRGASISSGSGAFRLKLSELFL